MKFNSRFWLISACVVLLFLSVKGSLFGPGNRNKQLPGYAAKIKERFDSGLFSKPLERCHDVYETTMKKWGFNKDLTRRKAVAEAEKNKAFTDSASKAQSSTTLIIISQKEAILALCKEYSKDPLAKEIKASLLFTPTEAEQKSIDYIQALKGKFQGDGLSPLENQLIRIDTEYWLKSLALTSALARHEWNLADFREHMIVLELEKMKQMSIACEETEFPNSEIAAHVKDVDAITAQLQAKHWANEAIMHLSKKSGADLTPFEKGIAKLIPKKSAHAL